MTTTITSREVAAAVAYALLGWLLAAAAMSVAIWKTRAPEAALSAHAIAIPLAFALVAFVYFRRPRSLPPVVAAALFGTTVLLMDALAAVVFDRSVDPRTLVLGTLVPAAVAFLSGWLTGIASALTGSANPR